MMRALVMAGIVAAALAASSCGGGQSSADQAKSKACSAVADIKTQLTKLHGVTAGTTTVNDAKTALDKISTDLGTIKTQVPQLKGSLKGQLQAANNTFKTGVQGIVDSIKSSQSLTGAATALAGAATTLQTAYTQAFAGVGC
jgi:hypothetical protein